MKPKSPIRVNPVPVNGEQDLKPKLLLLTPRWRPQQRERGKVEVGSVEEEQVVEVQGKKEQLV